MPPWPPGSGSFNAAANRHAAFLGGSGSGKTTVALNLVEQLLEGLETLRRSRGELLDASAKRLNFDGVAGRNASGQSRLIFIGTKFLGDQTTVRFWVAQFLNELRRWASKQPAAGLQRVCLFDEPATRPKNAFRRAF